MAAHHTRERQGVNRTLHFGDQRDAGISRTADQRISLWESALGARDRATCARHWHLQQVQPKFLDTSAHVTARELRSQEAAGGSAEVSVTSSDVRRREGDCGCGSSLRALHPSLRRREGDQHLATPGPFHDVGWPGMKVRPNRKPVSRGGPGISWLRVATGT